MKVNPLRVSASLLSAVLAVALCRPTFAQLYINEIFFEPGGSGDNTQEYIEIRGTPGMSLDDHYLIFLENENTATDSGSPGQIDLIFDLNGRTLSPTGFFTLRQRNNPYSNVPSDEFNVSNTLTGLGWGSTPNGMEQDNDIGAASSSMYSTTPGRIENSGFTAMLIRVNSGGAAPTLGMNLDGAVDNDGDPTTIHDGLDYPNGVENLPGDMPAWDIVDSIGIFSESSNGGSIGEAIYGRTYAKINYGPEIPGETYSFLDNGVPTMVTFEPNITDDQTYIGVGYEIEHIARWGDSIGQVAANWHITNDTNNTNAGFLGAADGFRQSGAYHDSPLGADDFVETNQYVPYGANLTNTIGAANYPLNLTQLPWDYNGNGEVDAADYVVWRKTLGSTTDLRADGNGGKEVEADDYLWWAARFGTTLSQAGLGSAVGAAFPIPEPVSAILATSALIAMISIRHQSRYRESSG
jgi:hypothetical protein